MNVPSEWKTPVPQIAKRLFTYPIKCEKNEEKGNMLATKSLKKGGQKN
jgi:hypothetical protein